MNHNAISIRPFIGAADYELSRHFYRDLNFEEIEIVAQHVFIQNRRSWVLPTESLCKEWIDNTMIF